MFKDDRMISILSGIVLMMAIGTLVQRGDVVSEFFGGADDPIVLVDDALTVNPDTLTRIDVLENDEGVRRADAERLAVLSQPDCGRVFVQDGALQFLAENDCEAQQVVTYGLTDEEELRPGVVTVTVRGATGIRRAPEPSKTPDAVALAPTPAPATADAAPATPASRGTTHRAGNAPQLVDPSGGRVASPEPGGELPEIGGVAAAPRVAAPAAPGLPGGGAPAMPSAAGASGFEAGGLAAPSAPGSGLEGSELAGLTAPSAPATNSRPVVSSPALGGGFGSSLPPAGGAAPSMPSSGLQAPAAPSLAPALAPSLAPSVPSPSLASPAAPSLPVPGAGGADTALAAAEPVAPAMPGGLAQLPQPGQPGTLQTQVDGSSGALDAPVRGTAGVPQGIEQPVPTIALARVETPVPSAAPARPASGLSLDLSGPSVVAPMGPPIGAQIDGTGGTAIALAEPTSGLGDIMSFNSGIALALIDTSEPAPLVAPREETPVDHGTAVAAIDPSASVLPELQRGAQEAQPEAAAPQLELAALPNAELACVVPPSITLDIRAAGETLLMINSPCHADSVAELAYDKLRLGVRIDRGGRGEIMVLGFENSADAVLSFADDEKLDFTVPFTGIDRVERVALSWDAPVALDLHAFEFNAERGGEGHVHKGAPRSFEEVRRRGGGFLTSFEPVEGVGQHVQVYTHWIRRGGNWGVVRLSLDFPSRHRDRLEGTCGSGELSRPTFTITRSARGRFEGADTRRIAAIGCDHLEKIEDHLIGDAVRDIIISQR